MRFFKTTWLIPLSIFLTGCPSHQSGSSNTRFLGEPCDDQFICQEGLFCTDKICRKVCSSPDDCDNNYDCISNICIPKTTKEETCGNKKMDVGELCDDGNKTDGDGCNAQCAIEIGWSCQNGTDGSVCKKLCGNGVQDAGEQCDDGNSNNGDGCSNCFIDVHHKCAGWPSVCSCEDGYQDSNNDGNCLLDCPTCNGNKECHYAATGEALGCDCANGSQDSNSDDFCEPKCDCDASQLCSYEDGHAVCSCPEGTQDHDNNGTCLPTCTTFLAEGAGCGNYESCDDSSGEALCGCTIYVKSDSEGNGSSWENSAGTMEKALDILSTLRSSNAEKNAACQIWVNKNYSERIGKTMILENVKIYGGFSDESLPQERNRANHSTFEGNFSVTITQLSGAILLDGLVFSRGSLTNNALGGALYAANNQSLTVNNCIFFNNHHAVNIVGGTATFTDTVFSSNSYSNYSSGIKNSGALTVSNSEVIVDNCVFESNYGNAMGGGAIFNNNSSLTIKNSLFIDNGAGIGGAIHSIAGEDSSLAVDNSQFIDNSCSTYTCIGGAIYNETDNAKFSNIFIGVEDLGYDTDAMGGGIYNIGKNVTVVNSVFDYIAFEYSPYINAKRKKAMTGGAIYNAEQGTMQIAYSDFINLTSNKQDFEGIYNENEAADSLVVYNSLLKTPVNEDVKVVNSLDDFSYKKDVFYKKTDSYGVKIANSEHDTKAMTVKYTFTNSSWQKNELRGKWLELDLSYRTLLIPIIENGPNYILIHGGYEYTDYQLTQISDFQSLSIVDYHNVLDKDGTLDLIVDKANTTQGPQPATDMAGQPRKSGKGADIGACEIK